MNFKSILRPLWQAALALCLIAQTLSAGTEGPLTYSEDGSSITITACNNGASGALVIPATINSKPVTSIGNDAFNSCGSLTSVTIPSSVTSIGNGAFSFCYRLTSMTIPSSVTSIGNSVFRNCYGLISVTIPSSVTSIGVGAFYSCYGLTSVTIPNSVTSIGNDAFSICTSLTSVTIPNSVTSIGVRAFQDCRSLAGVAISNSVTSIANYAFQDCRSLISVTIPTSVTSIGMSAFQSCGSLRGVTIPTSVTSIGGWAFYGCGTLTSVTIPNSVTSIGNDAFNICWSLTSVTIPNSVTSIGGRAFQDCIGLTSATFLGNAPTMGGAVFDGTAAGFKVNFIGGNTGFDAISYPKAYFSNTVDTDGDGMNDAAEILMSALGFDWQVNQAAMVNTYYSDANVHNQAQYDANRTTGRSDVLTSPNTYSLYTLSQVKALNIDVPLLVKDSGTGKFKLTMGVKKSNNLATTPFVDFPLNSAGTAASINAEGKLELEFTSPDNAAFFRLEGEIGAITAFPMGAARAMSGYYLRKRLGISEFCRFDIAVSEDGVVWRTVLDAEAVGSNAAIELAICH